MIEYFKFLYIETYTTDEQFIYVTNIGCLNKIFNVTINSKKKLNFKILGFLKLSLYMWIFLKLYLYLINQQSDIGQNDRIVQQNLCSRL